MGVQGLWELLAPVGRRVSVETLAGKKLAIDASIWMIQFLKAMRDEKGEMVRNAHILGFFRRICKLLFLRTKPVFVFDGSTPALKRRTVAARRRHRDDARAKIRKTAEKLLLNHLKAKKLEELANEIKSQRQKGDSKGKQVDDTKGKHIVSSDDDTKLAGTQAVGASNQESLDELLAASLAAEEEGRFGDNEPASIGNASYGQEDDGDEDEEMIFPVASSNIDPAALASLPPSMQLDLLVQMRESLMAENRQKYQKIKKVPTKFSELQIQSYLKTVAFRREIDEVQKCAAGRGLGGVQTSRIASEANREFIFSSSFNGDKQMLTSTVVQKNGDADHHVLKKKPAISDLLKHSSSTSQSKSTTDASVGKSVKNFGDDVETYCDERGRLRVSRVRALGMRMTRDLQRNLDLMKEYEQERRADFCTEPEPFCTKDFSDTPNCLSEVNHAASTSISNDGNNKTISRNNEILKQKYGRPQLDEQSMPKSEETLEISFVEDDDGMKDPDDLFLHLVSGSSKSKLFYESASSEKSANESDSECIWEEGVVEKKESLKTDHKESCKYLAGMSSFEEDEVNWEEGTIQLPEVSSQLQDGHEKVASSGMLEEETDIQEAIRRSLEDFQRQKSSSMSNENENLGISLDQNNGSLVCNSTVENSRVNILVPLESSLERSSSHYATTDGLSELANGCRKDVPRMLDSSEKQLSSSMVSVVSLDVKPSLIDEMNEKILVSSVVDNGTEGTVPVTNIPVMEPSDGHFTQIEQCMDTSKQVGDGPSLRISIKDFAESSSKINLETSGSSKINLETAGSSKINLETAGNVGDTVLAHSHYNDFEAFESSCSFGRRYNNDDFQKSSLVEETVANRESEQCIEKDYDVHIVEAECLRGHTMTEEYSHDHIELAEDNLDKEISLLQQERVDLGDEQRKLERNAESVSSEMFVECQELLQIFGLPYIIAPMEAEAQCAYMEMTNLVDGVVTDDSDVFLFGARNVYKNIFDDRKYVETYFMKDIESELGLTREKLIRMALLLGSDYTEGISGIGIVNAIEVVHAFPEEDGLQKFREWIESPDPAILGKLDPHTGSKLKKRSSKPSNNDAVGMRNKMDVFASEEDSALRGSDDQTSVDDSPNIKNAFMSKHRNVSKNWHIPSFFPSDSVISAYTSPQVDESTDPFSWGKPDLVLLRKLCWERFGWGNQKADELLVPVLKEYNKHETQLRLEAFYNFNERFAKIRSKRIKKAVKGITGTHSSELMDDLVHEGSSSRRKRRSSPSTVVEYKPGDSSDGKASSKRKASKPPRRLDCESQDMHTKDGAGNPLILDQGRKNAKSGLHPNEGGGRRRGRGRGRGRGREPNNQCTEASYSDNCRGAGDMEKNVKEPEFLSELRRSTRHRKNVKYSEEDVEVDEHSGPSNQNDGDSSHEAAMEHERAEKDVRATDGDSSGLDEGGNPSPSDRVSRDYIVSGGGFCMDESDSHHDAAHPAVSSSGDFVGRDSEVRFDDAFCLDKGGDPLEDSSSREHLFSGGGFCVEESDTQGDAVQQTASPVNDSVEHSRDKSNSDNARSSDLGSSTGQDNLKTVFEQHVPENSLVEGEGNQSTLSAMPSLKRKRRKA